MSKKILVIIGMAIVLAATGGVIAMNTGNNDKNHDQKTASTTEVVSGDVTSDVGDNDDSGDVVDDNGEDISLPDDDDTDVSEDNGDEETPLPTSYDASVVPSVPYEDQLITASMTIQFVVDNSTGAQESPRVAFGENYKYCYATFDADKSFEMCVDPTAGTIRRGTYQVYGNIVSVQYEDGSGSEYDILTDEEGNVTHVIVNYGDYSIYFG